MHIVVLLHTGGLICHYYKFEMFLKIYMNVFHKLQSKIIEVSLRKR